MNRSVGQVKSLAAVILWHHSRVESCSSNLRQRPGGSGQNLVHSHVGRQPVLFLFCFFTEISTSAGWFFFLVCFKMGNGGHTLGSTKVSGLLVFLLKGEALATSVGLVF